MVPGHYTRTGWCGCCGFACTAGVHVILLVSIAEPGLQGRSSFLVEVKNRNQICVSVIALPDFHEIKEAARPSVGWAAAAGDGSYYTCLPSRD